MYLPSHPLRFLSSSFSAFWPLAFGLQVRVLKMLMDEQTFGLTMDFLVFHSTNTQVSQLGNQQIGELRTIQSHDIQV